MKPSLRRPLPENRTYDQLLHHFTVEKELANRLREADRESRKTLYPQLYVELFQLVPDHSRLHRRSSNQLSAKANVGKRRFVERYLNEDTLFLEFAPGDCRFAASIAPDVKKIYGVDISDQRDASMEFPDNFELVLYDGFETPLPEKSVNVVFSDQLIEHFHIEDTEAHFRIVLEIMKQGGRYVFRTPHAYTGPHDISKFFSDTPEGFHMKEWTYRELKELTDRVGFSQFVGIWKIKALRIPLPFAYFQLVESVLEALPRKISKPLARWLLPSLVAEVIR
ncbi:MAG: class I SAM-dependent methyltransferase [Verrucomicrobiota bacterium]